MQTTEPTDMGGTAGLGLKYNLSKPHCGWTSQLGVITSGLDYWANFCTFSA